MSTNSHKIIQSQYLAALKMLRQAVEACPEDLWDDRSQPNRFWQIAYHALIYGHFYLHASEEEFKPWVKARMELRSFAPDNMPADMDICTPAHVLEFMDFVESEVPRLVQALDLEAQSGFSWLPFNKQELQFYNIRHIQQHTGELYQQLATQHVELHWVGYVDLSDKV